MYGNQLAGKDSQEADRSHLKHSAYSPGRVTA